MTLPLTCELWRDPETALARPMKDQFERAETLFQDSHHWRYLLVCRGCGARYMLEFYEEIDWDDGDDPSWVSYVPVQSEAQLVAMRAAFEPLALRGFPPYLQMDHPKGAPKAPPTWMGRDPSVGV